MLSVILTHATLIVLVVLTFGLIFGFSEFGGVGFDASTNARAVFSWHPLLNLIAYGFLLAEGFIAFRVWGWTRPQRKTLHSVLQCVVSILAILSLTAVVVFHNAIKAPNFYSVHSWIGLLVYVLTWCQFLGGLLIFGIPNLASPELKLRVMPLHKFSGLIMTTSKAIVHPIVCLDLRPSYHLHQCYVALACCHHSGGVVAYSKRTNQASPDIGMLSRRCR
eukprot:GHVS01007648.1.p1 GENE.GHVS01007648.1~~GHVS01007648.1.p1  ORF type:complete len:220 (-),score=0.83 GHVS01007648.1:523-1182(-)